MLRIRPYRQEDASSIVTWCEDELTHDRWCAGLLGNYPLSAQSFNEFFSRRVWDDRFFPFTAFDEEGPCGFFSLRHPTESLQEIRFGFVIVAPRLRGQGIGQQMLRLGLRFAFDVYGASTATLGVFENNPGAYHCYRSVGFRENGQTDTYNLHGETWKCIEMTLSSVLREDELFMKEAIRLSFEAVRHGNEPFGAVLVKDGRIVCTNENQIYTAHDPTFHAEAGLIRRFMAETGLTDLSDYTLYSSCEPCFMCAGAMVWSRLGRLVYAAGNEDLEAILGNEGCSTTRLVFEHSFHQPRVTSGVLRDEALALLRSYFSRHAKG